MVKGGGDEMEQSTASTGSVRTMLALAAAASMALLLGCAGGRPDYGQPEVLMVEEAPLGGEALAQRRQDLTRAYGDVVAFQTTMASLIDRRDTRSLSAFDEFVAEYLGSHLDVLLVAEWQSGHPEVMEVDANLRFAKADLLTKMRYPRRVQRVIDDIERRYQDRANMLVEYPAGEQHTLAEALQILQSRKWDG